MKYKIKNIIISFSFFTFLASFAILNFSYKDIEISKEERRRLSQMPKFNMEEIFSGKYFEELEKYFLDQIPFREDFRKIKNISETKLLGKKDNNDYFNVNGNIFKNSYTLNEDSIKNTAEFYNKIATEIFNNQNIYYSIIPDKNYFLNDEKYLKMDYSKLIEIMKSNTKNMSYINIMDDLQLSDYYKTDIHWSQDKIIKIGDKILKSLNRENKSSDYKYEERSHYPFYGSYYGSALSNIRPDKLKYLTNHIIENSIVYDYESNKTTKIYDEENLNNVDNYDVYLEGPKALLEIKNPLSKSKKELFIFRDSFGSSLAPLLISEYSKITLIDLRYISANQLNNYISLSHNYDVLFMLNTLIMNESNLFIK